MNAKKTKEMYSNLEKLYEEGIFKSKKVVFFGLNLPTYKSIIYLKAKGVNISLVIDNYKYKGEKSILGIDVKRPEHIKINFNKDYIILIASQYHEEMTNQILAFGYSFENIYVTLKILEKSYDVDTFKEEVENVNLGLEVFLKINEEKRENTIIMLPYGALGDAFYIASYLRSYLEKENIENYAITTIGVVSKKVLDMFKLKNIVRLTQEESDSLLEYARITGFDKTKIRCITHNLIHSCVLVGLEKSKRLYWGEIIKELVMGIKKDQPQELPTIEISEDKIDKYCQEVGIIRKKSVIISPYANTLAGIDIDIWEEIVIKLKEKGLRVFTNSSNEKSEPVIKGSKGVFFPIQEAIKIVEYAGMFIGLRSGFCDIVSVSQAKLIVLYPDTESFFFTIKRVGFGNKKLKEINCKNKGEKLADIIINKLDL